MAASLRGQLGVKSSALSPTSSKYTTQLLVLDHMTNHYRKLNKAKPAIDNAPPKSMQISQKMRDRKRRKDIEKYGSRPSSSMSYHPTSREEDIYDESQWDEPEDDEERQVRDIMRTTLRVPLKATHPHDSTAATAGSRSEQLGYTVRPHSATLRGTVQAVRGAGYLNRSRPLSSRSTTSLASNTSQVSRSSNPMKATYDGDILDKHAHVFKEPEKPFTPRTLKSNRESSLKRYKYYTPPKKSHVTYDDQSQTDVKQESRQAPQARPRRRNKGDPVDLAATETLTETKLMEMSLRSHDPRHPGDSGDVPRLDISMDKDHMNWLQEQASKAQIRARNNSGNHEGGSCNHDSGDTLERTETLNNTDTLRFTRTGTSAKSFGVKSPTSRRLGQAEEEQKYVTFAHEVTQDIVSRGICSDRVLNKVFEGHIERKKGELDERRLRAIITDIRRDLGVDHTQLPEARVKLEDDHDATMDNELDGTTRQLNGDTLGLDSTMMSQTNTSFNFDRTTDVFSTIRSEARDRDIGAEEEGELSATQALEQYQMDLTVQDNASERHSASQNGLDHSHAEENGTDETPASTLQDDAAAVANGHDEADDRHSVHSHGVNGTDPAAHLEEPKRPPRRLARQKASVADHEPDQEVANDAASDAAGSRHQERRGSKPNTDTEARTEEDYEDEEYEDDYDADEDDGQEEGSDDDF